MTEREHALLPSMVHRRRKLVRWLAILVLLGAVAAIAAVILRFTRQSTITECERTFRRSEYQHAIDLCIKSHDRTQDTAELVWAAEAYLALGKYDQASALAQRLIGGTHYGAGHKILSNVLVRTTPPKPQEAKFHATAAVQAYARTQDRRGHVNASLALAQAAWALGEFGVTFAAATEAAELASQLGNRRIEVSAQLLRADALQNLGDQDEAASALAKANERAQHPCDKAWTAFRMGIHQMNGGLDSIAEKKLLAAQAENESCRDESMKLPLELSLAWLERRKEPRSALERLDTIKAAGGEGFESLLLRAYLAADRGDLDEAAAYLDQAKAAEPPDADWAWNLATAEAELAELRGGLLGELAAEYHYRRAIAMVEALRAETPTGAATLVASHRGPFDGLLSLYARTGRWRDAFAVVLELDASDMLRSTAAASAHGGAATVAGVTAAQLEPRRPPPPIEHVLRAWAESQRDLAIAIAPAAREIGRSRERAYRMRVVGGELSGEDVGDAKEVRRLAEDLYTDPGDAVIGRLLGRIMIPPGDSPTTLDVLAIGVLGKAPLTALRGEDGAPIIARRPLARVVALRAERIQATGRGAPVVLADPTGDLPDARREGQLVADALGAGARVFGLDVARPATLSAFDESGNAELLHVAGHADGDEEGRFLALANSKVRPAHIVKERIAPQIAVLASCGSFAAQDHEGWGSLATALLEAGTSTVIATDRTVPDNASLVLMQAFYRQPDWRTAPAAALARVQVAAMKDPAIKFNAWAAFIVIQRPPALHDPTLR